MKAYSYVRWSSAQQTKGHSRERQTDLAAKYAAKHKLTLDNLSYQDHGVSAFKGKNVSQGKLGAFIRAIDEGVVKTPCYLLVEDIDRLSRNEIDLSLDLMLSLIRQGVTIVTLQNEQVYSTEGIRGDAGIASLVTAIAKLQGAHEYSKRLGQRVKAAWDKKKHLRTQGVIVTKSAPSWLTPKPDKSGWIVDKKKADIVRRIFALAKAGNGVHKITKILNQEGVPNIGTRRRRNDAGELVEREDFWSYGNVSGFFRNEAAFGRYTSDDGKHVKDDYYPEIVAKADFYAIKAARKRRRGTGGFNQGTTNLFSNITRCAYCTKALKIRNYKKIWLQCRNTLHNACTAKRVDYAVLESDLLNALISWTNHDYDPQKMDESLKSKRKLLQQQLDEKLAYLDAMTSMKEVAKAKRKGEIITLSEKLAEAESEVDALQAELAQLKGEGKTALGMQERIDEVVELIYALSDEPTDELRKEVRERLREHIKYIDVAPHLEENPKHFKKFKVEKKPTAPLHMVRITYADGSVGLLNIVGLVDDEQDARPKKKRRA